MLTPTIADLLNLPLVAGATYAPPAGESPYHWRDAYYRRLLAAELPEALAFVTSFLPFPLLVLSIATLPAQGVDAAAERTSEASYFTYVPGRLTTTYDAQDNLAEPNFRLRFINQSDLAAYLAEPSAVCLYEVLADARVEADLEFQAYCVDNLDTCAAQMRNIIVGEFFIDNLSVFALLRTQVCFTQSYSAEAAAIFAEFRQKQQANPAKPVVQNYCAARSYKQKKLRNE